MKKNRAELFCPLLILLIYGILYGSRCIDMSALQYKDNYYLSLIVLQLLIFILPAIIYCRLKGTGYAMRLNLRPVRPSILGITILGVLMLIAGSWLIRLGQIYVQSGGTDVSFSLYNIYYPTEKLTVGNTLYISLTFALLPALTEEFVFRCLLFTEYTEGGFGFFSVSLITSLLFAMLHFSRDQFAVYFLGGLVFAGLTYATRSSLPAFACHFLYNLYGIFGEVHVMKIIEKTENAVLLLFTFAILFLLFLIGFLGEAERLQYVSGIEDEETPEYVTERNRKFPGKRDRLRHNILAWVSPFFLLCIAFYFAVTRFIA